MKTIYFEIADCDLDATLGCGQCFRWERLPDGSWRGVPDGAPVRVWRAAEGLAFEGPDVPARRKALADYFDLGRDYAALRGAFSTDAVLRRAVAFAPGMRLLRQEPWEALCSFILSQNNNIARIRGIVGRLCERFGDPLPGGGTAFPTPERLAALDEAALAPVRCGFRARYVLDAARRVASGDVDLEAARVLPLGEAQAMLEKICGVGPKVADCALLYGCGRLACVPMDVWMKRVMAAFYPQGLPARFAPVAGIAQQYLFHYARHLESWEPPDADAGPCACRTSA